MSIYGKYSLGEILKAQKKFNRYVELVCNYQRRSSKKRPLILENGCLNYEYSHCRVKGIGDGNLELQLYDTVHEEPFFSITLEDCIENRVYWHHDKYNTLVVRVDY